MPITLPLAIVLSVMLTVTAAIFVAYLHYRSKQPVREHSPIFQFMVVTLFIFSIVLVLMQLNENFAKYIDERPWIHLLIIATIFLLFLTPALIERLGKRKKSVDVMEDHIVSYLNTAHHGALNPSNFKDASFSDMKRTLRIGIGEFGFPTPEEVVDFVYNTSENLVTHIKISPHNLEVVEHHVNVSRSKVEEAFAKESAREREEVSSLVEQRVVKPKGMEDKVL